MNGCLFGFISHSGFVPTYFMRPFISSCVVLLWPSSTNWCCCAVIRTEMSCFGKILHQPKSDCLWVFFGAVHCSLGGSFLDTVVDHEIWCGEHGFSVSCCDLIVFISKEKQHWDFSGICSCSIREWYKSICSSMASKSVSRQSAMNVQQCPGPYKFLPHDSNVFIS